MPFLESDKQIALLFIRAAAAHANDSTDENRTATLFSSRAFIFYAAALLNELAAVHEKAFPANESTFEKVPSSQSPRTKASSLSVEVMLVRTMSLFS